MLTEADKQQHTMPNATIEIMISAPSETELFLQYKAPAHQISALKGLHYRTIRTTIGEDWWLVAKRYSPVVMEAIETDDGIHIILESGGQRQVEFENGLYQVQCSNISLLRAWTWCSNYTTHTSAKFKRTKHSLFRSLLPNTYTTAGIGKWLSKFQN
ncbi:hypothetical protein BJX99DRAFT_160078 [Aspergillus californicus]